jgi:hypothetical protein
MLQSIAFVAVCMKQNAIFFATAEPIGAACIIPR